MADNMTTELEGGPGPEGQLNTKSELDPQSVVTFIYRGENPYMRFLARGLQERGMSVSVREISDDQFDSFQKSLRQFRGQQPSLDEEKKHTYSLPQGEERKAAFEILQEKEEAATKEFSEYRKQQATTLIGPIEGIAVTDYTMKNNTLAIVGREHQIRGYDALEWENITEPGVREKLAPIIEQIRAAGKIPVLLQRHIGDHIEIDNLTETEREETMSIAKEIISGGIYYRYLPSLMGEDTEAKKDSIRDRLLDRKDYKRDGIYAALIKKNFDVPIISDTDFGFTNVNQGPTDSGSSGQSNIVEILQNMGINPENTVLLADHHLRKIQAQEVQERGLDKVEIVRICPCCLIMSGGHPEEQEFGEELQKRGFRLFPIQIEADNKAIDNLMQSIEQKRAEIEAQKLTASLP